MPSLEPASVADLDEARDTALEAERNGSSNPQLARELGRWVIEHSSDPLARVRAYRAIGTAARTVRDHTEMESAFQSAVEAAERVGLSSEAAFSRVLLASAHVIFGRATEALALLASAVEELDGDRRTMAVIQLGIVKATTGDHRGSLATLDSISAAVTELPVHRQAIYHKNRGVSLIELGEPARAIDELEHAIDLYQAVGESHLSVRALFNLARAYAGGGLTSGALDCFRRVDDLDTGVVHGVDWVDRAAVLRSAGLLVEAEQAASEARSMLPGHETEVWMPTAALIHAEILEVLGKTDRAVSAAESAVEIFNAQGRPALADVAAGVSIRCRAVMGGADESDEEADQLASRMASAGAVGPALGVRLSIARAASSVERVRHHLGSALAQSVHGIEERMMWKEASARLALLDGKRDAAQALVDEALTELTDWRQTIGSTELQAVAARWGVHLADLAVGAAVAAGDLESVLMSVERQKVAAVISTPQNELPAELSRLLAEYRAVGMRGRGQDVRAERTRLEEHIRRESRSSNATPMGLDLPDVATVFEYLAEETLVEFFDVDGAIHALVVTPSRRHTMVSLGSCQDVKSEVDSLRFAITRMSAGLGSDSSLTAFQTISHAAARNLDRLLIAPLGLSGDGAVVVIPSHSLDALPWGALPGLRDRSFSIAPSARLWAKLRNQAEGVGAITVGLSDPATATREALEVAAIRGGDSLIGDEATAETVLRGLEGVAVAHLACHGTFRSDMPLMSGLHLADGPLTVYDLESLSRAPTTLVISACEVAQNRESAGSGLMGMSASVMAAGTRSVIAATTVVSDEATRPFMVDWHHSHAAGASPSRALADAREQAGDDPAEQAVAASFVCIGV